MMKALHFICCLFLCYYATGQSTFAKQWDVRFGGIDGDFPNVFSQTADGGYIVAGICYSRLSGDKTQPNWDASLNTPDYWVVKMDAQGNKQWDKRFGGTSEDDVAAIQQTADGGYLIGGTSGSGANGDKTQGSRGGYDYWVIRVDASGNTLWDRRFGGDRDDIMMDMCKTADRGFVLAGYSESGISGDKTQDNRNPGEGTADYWVVKIDSAGNKVWDKRFGGGLDDYLNSIRTTNDGGYILGGTSQSDSGFDKSQHTYGFGDFWIVKIDSSGNKQWDQRYGTSSDDHFAMLQQTYDGGYILGGNADTGKSGDKSVDASGYWIVKTDLLGNKLWDQAYTVGNLASVYLTLEKGFILSGNTTNNIFGDKTQINLGYWQDWVIKADSIGNKEWDETMLTYGEDGEFGGGGYAIPTSDGCYAVAISCNGSIGGYKTQPNWDTTNASYDFWMIKFCMYPTAVNNLNSKANINVYPNPFNAQLAVSVALQNAQQAEVTLINLTGQTIYTQHETNLSPIYTKMLDLSYLPNGVYFLEVVVDGERMVREVVKQ